MTLWIAIAIVGVILVIVVCRLMARVIRDINRYERGYAPTRRRSDRRTDRP